MPQFHYNVLVSADTQGQADQVMIERLGFDEDYGFEYTVVYYSIIDGAPFGTNWVVRCSCGHKVNVAGSSQFAEDGALLHAQTHLPRHIDDPFEGLT